MSHIARMLTAVVVMLGLVCLTMPGTEAAANPCVMVYTYTNLTPDQARFLADQAANREVTYDPQTKTATIVVHMEHEGCQGTRNIRTNISDPYAIPNPPPGSRSSSSTGSGQTGTSSTHQTTGSGSTAPKYPKGKRPATQTAPSSPGAVK